MRGLRWLARGVYPAFLPVDGPVSPSTERYLEDLWREAPWRVALAHTGVVLCICLLPLFLLGRPRLFPALTQEEQSEVLMRMHRSRWYALRLAAAAARTAALLAALRVPEDRLRLLAPHAG
jgi:hypothetical protein